LVALLPALIGAIASSPATAKDPPAKRGDAKSFEGPHGLKVMVRVMVPQDQETDLLFLCFFKHQKKGDTVLATIQKFDDQLGGLIASLRNRGEFSGEELETILINPPAGSIKARKLMLIGLGEEDKLSLKTMRRIGAVALREAARLGVKRAAFGAAIRDQGNDKLAVGDVGKQVIEGAMLAFDTEKRLHKEGLGGGLGLEEWIYLAGPEYFNEVFPSVGEGLAAASALAKSRSDRPYAKSK
jgi:hypothetical protein